MKDIKVLACQWAMNAVAQVFWNLTRRGVPDDQRKLVCAGSFEALELQKVTRSRWSNSRKMAVVDNATDFDLEAILGDSGAVDFNKGLTPEERKDRARLAGVSFAPVGAGDFGAKNTSSCLSTKTTTPGKEIPDPKSPEDKHTMAKSIITYDTRTTNKKGNN